MTSLLLLTNDLLPSAEVLPALGLLSHQVRVMPAEATALLRAPACDALLVDGRRDLPAVRGLTRLLRQQAVAETLRLAAGADLALVGVGGTDDDATIETAGIAPMDVLEAVYA